MPSRSTTIRRWLGGQEVFGEVEHEARRIGERAHLRHDRFACGELHLQPIGCPVTCTRCKFTCAPSWGPAIAK